MSKYPVYFVSHGGGPWPWMKEATGPVFERLEASLQGIALEIEERPKAILMISGHWEAPAFTVSSAATPGMIYDYTGFPPHTYSIKYPAPGDPALADRVRQLLDGSGLMAAADAERGFDHGTFTVMVSMYPDADVPVVQLSLQQHYDPELHLRAGRALAPLRSEGVVIIGSGFSYHNLPQMRSGGGPASHQFDAWLQQAVVQSTPTERWQQLVGWEAAPSARDAHPQEDHLLPLMVAAGAAEHERATCFYHEDDLFGSIAASSFRFGDVPEREAANAKPL